MAAEGAFRMAAWLHRIGFLLPLLLITVLPARAALDRWAIISAGNGKEMALSDLVTAELSRAPGLVLVERDALQQVTDEQLLTKAISAGGVTSRLQLGEMLNADALLVLWMGGNGDTRTLTVMVIHCPTGTRLRIEQFPWKPDNTPALSSHLRDLVGDVRRQYADGIKKIIGVPNFISRSFSRDYDPLQESYSLLLQQVLMLEPGVAVIDTGEAQAIGRELALGGTGRIERILPLMVQGEFRVETAGGTPSIALSVKLTDKTGIVATADSGPLTLAKAPEWLTTTLPAKVWAGEANATPLSRSAQAQLLEDRAEVFARLGCLDQSIPLRESALLLYPDTPKARPALVDEYFRLYYDILNPGRPESYLCYVQTANTAAGTGETPDLDRTVTEMVAGYLRALDHAEYIFLRRQTGPTAIASSMDTLCSFTYHLQGIRRDAGLQTIQHPVAMQQLARADRARQRFLLEIIPVIMTYPETDSTVLLKEYDANILKLYHNISLLTFSAISHGGTSREDLPFIRTVAEVMPTGYYPFWVLEYTTNRGYYASNFTEADYWAFLNELIGSTNALVSCSAKLTLLKKHFQQIKGNKDQLLALQDEIEKLGTDLKVIPATYRAIHDHSVLVDSLRMEVAKALEQLNALPPSQPAPDMKKNICAVQFDKIVLSDGKPSASPTPFHGMQLIPSQKFDIVWYMNGQLYFHRTAGMLEPIQWPAGMKTAPLIDVAWDGLVLWAMTGSGEIREFDAVGKYLGAVTGKDGLLAYSAGSRLYPIAPGRILAVGVSDKDQRTWCAMVTWDTEKHAAAVQVFHEAVETPITTDGFFKSRYARNPKMVFQEFKIFKLDGIMPGDGPIMGISRILVQQNGRWYLDPLTINLQTLQVGIWSPQTGLQDLTYFEPVMLTSAGDLLGFDDDYRPSLRLTAVTPGKTPSYHLITITNPAAVGPQTGYADQTDLLHIYLNYPYREYRTLLSGADGWIYLLGAKFYRIDPKTLTAQRLATQPPPPERMRLHYAVSSLLGLIGWNDTEIYRITIDETKIPQTGD